MSADAVSLTSQSDYAVVIGISVYPKFPELRPLASPRRDAEAFASWLTNSAGVPANQVQVLVNDSSGTDHPNRSNVDAAFERLLPSEGGRRRRLYIYVSGHGYASERDSVVLLLAGATRLLSDAIDVREYADYFRLSGAFEEVVLFADCARSIQRDFAPPMSFPFATLRRSPGEESAYLYGFAAAYGSEAFEIPQPGGVSGVFSSALMSGLSGGAAGADGSITSQTLASYVSIRIRELAPDRQQTPVFTLDPSRLIVFSGEPARTASSRPSQTSAQATGRQTVASVESVAYPTPRIASDRWATDDALGYGAFARTVATLITHPDTLPPLTVGIKAPWGAGKTSLMKRIQYLLDGRASVTEENEAAWLNRDFEINLTLRQLLVGLRTLSGMTSVARTEVIRERVRNLIGRTRAFFSSRGEPARAGAGVAELNPSKTSQARDERFEHMKQILQRMADAMSTAARRLQFSRPEVVRSSEGLAADIPGRISVWFNAWKYQTSEQIWAGLAHCIISQVTARMSPASRELFWLKLHASRVDVNQVRWKARRMLLRDLLPLLLIGAVSLVVSLILLILGIVTWGGVGLSITALSWLASWLEVLRKLGEKVSDEFKELVREPDYEGKLGFLHLVESDIRDVLDMVATAKTPLIVFVDDLDRCAPHQVAEVVEAINLFLSGDYPNCIFVLGMEPAIVAAALEVANKDLLEKVREFGVVDSQVPLGWRFMEKIVQLPLAIPAPDADGAQSYLKYLTGGSDAGPTSTSNQPPAADQVAKYLQEFKAVETVDSVVKRTNELIAEAPAELRAAVAEASKRVYAQKFTDRDPAISRFIKGTLSLFQGNPRQLKRYVNLFRFFSTLRHTLVTDRLSTGRPYISMPSDEVLTKFIALSIHWPQAADYLRLVRQLDSPNVSKPEHGALLGRLEEGAFDLSKEDRDAADERWTRYLKELGMEQASWARARDFREFLARGERLAGHDQCGLW